jgi:hypothetical protein
METTMFKVALPAATVLVAASMAMAGNSAIGAGAPLADDAPSCDRTQSLDPGCALRIVDTNGDGTISADELARFASPAPLVDWAPLQPPRSTGLDFKDAAVELGSVLPATLDRDTSHPLIPALFALGAMVVLLPKRPV